MRPPRESLLTPLTPSVALHTHLYPLAERGLKVERLLGIGGTSEVALVRDQNGEAFALKRLLGIHRDSRAQRDALLFEGVHLSLIRSSKVIRCHELLTLPLPSALIQEDLSRDPSALSASERHEVALLLDYIEGAHLRSLLKMIQQRRQPPLQPEEVASLIYDISEGLRGLHQATRSKDRPCPITHGDLSPTNILLKLRGSALLIDLSSASSLLNAKSDYGRPGKRAYLSPGLKRGEVEGTTGDLYALGIIWFELVTGSHPPAHTHIRQSELRRAGWPPAWSTVVAGLLSPSVAHREVAFKRLSRSTIWGEDASQHRERQRLARRSLELRVRHARAAQSPTR